ncbi:MAG: SPASM domain-containing protein [Sedimentisphaerales bacterium]|nr:SPASM domain-containing protein [Sedimentisphaerales bacterium]
MICETDKKSAAVLYADQNRSTLGTQGRIAQILGDTAVLTRTIKRLEAVVGLNDILVFCPSEQEPLITELTEGTRATVCGLAQEVPVSKAIRKRKWSLRGWRGGLGASTQFDELPFTAEMVQILQERQIEVVISIAPEAVVVDPKLLSELLAHHKRNDETMRFTFSQTAPGLAGCVYRLDLVNNLVQVGEAVGALLTYKPESPEQDLVNHECTLRVAQELCTSPYRYLADTAREMEAMEAIAKALDQMEHDDQEQDETDTATEGSWGHDACRAIEVMAQEKEATERLPREIDIEINTERSLRIVDYPHSQLAGTREAMDIELFSKIVDDCSAYDDICLTIGGFGEPLAHRDLIGMIERAKSAGIFGINIETDGRLLEGELAEQLLAADIDVISVHLDADSAALYQQLKGENCFERVVNNIETFTAKAKAEGKITIVPHMVKMRATMAEMESFYDRWITICGAAVLTGFSDYAGQIADKAVMDMSPPNRWACERLSKRMTILADGTVCVCDQDFACKHVIGNVTQQSVEDIWRSKQWEQLRKEHASGVYSSCELCGKCRDWHRA